MTSARDPPPPAPRGGAAGEPGGVTPATAAPGCSRGSAGSSRSRVTSAAALRDVLALDDEDLVRAVAADAGAAAPRRAREAVDPASLRAARRRRGPRAHVPPRAGLPAAAARGLAAARPLLHGRRDARGSRLLLGGRDRRPHRPVAIVGTRKASHDGLEVARALGRGLSAAGRDGRQRHGAGDRQRGPCRGAGGVAAGPSPCSPAAPTSRTRRASGAARADRADGAPSSPRCRRGPRHASGASRRATGSSPGWPPRPSWSRPRNVRAR